jgi:hypothetical protein
MVDIELPSPCPICGKRHKAGSNPYNAHLKELLDKTAKRVENCQYLYKGTCNNYDGWDCGDIDDCIIKDPTVSDKDLEIPDGYADTDTTFVEMVTRIPTRPSWAAWYPTCQSPQSRGNRIIARRVTRHMFGAERIIWNTST